MPSGRPIKELVWLMRPVLVSAGDGLCRESLTGRTAGLVLESGSKMGGPGGGHCFKSTSPIRLDST